MKKSIIALMVSAALLVACKGGEKAAETTANSVQSEATAVTGNAIAQLSNEEAAVAQKEFLQILSIKDQSMVDMLQFTQTLRSKDPTSAANTDALQEKLYQSTLDVQKKIEGLKITNQDVKNYTAELSNLTNVGKKVYAAKAQIDKESKAGKLSESTEALLKEVQAAQTKVLQGEVVLTDSLSRIGENSPAKELLEIKNIQNKETVQLAGAMQTLMNDSSDDTTKAQKLANISAQANDATIAELKKLTITSSDVNAYRTHLINLGTLKAESLKKAEQIQKELTTNKKLSPENQQLIENLQKAGLQAEGERVQLTAKYAQ